MAIARDRDLAEVPAMPRYAALFLDDLDPAALEPELTRAHFAYLARHRGAITEAGGLRGDGGAPFCGSLWIIEADSLADATRLVEGDPYCRAGLRPDRRLWLWGRAPRPNGSNAEAEDDNG